MNARESLFPSPRHPARWLRFRLFDNWAQAWRVGPVELEIEWVAKADQYTFSLSFDFSGGRYDDYTPRSPSGKERGE